MAAASSTDSGAGTLAVRTCDGGTVTDLEEQRPPWIARAARNMADTWRHVASCMGGRWERGSQAWVADQGSICPFLNNVVLAGPLDEGQTPTLVARLETFYSQREGGSWLLWSGWPTPDLTSHGFTFWGEPPLMVRPPGGTPPPVPANLQIEEVTDRRTLRDFERTLVDGYPAPWLQPYRPGCAFDARLLGGPLRLFVGYAGDDAVSVSAAFVDDEVVGVFMVATLPDARGKGYGTALTWAATNAAPMLPAVLLASDLGFPIYERLGYAVVSRFGLWERPRIRAS